MNKQDGVAARSAADLERKYQFGKQFREVMGLANDAREAAYKVESDLRNEILEQSTTLTRNTEQIVMTALKSYVQTGDLEEFKKTFETKFGVLAEGIYGQVKATNDSLNAVNQDLQNRFNELSKYFSFTINGLEIGATYIDENGEEKTSPNHVIIDNDEITIMVGSKEVIRFDAYGNALIPTLKVEDSINVVGLSVTEDDTHINCAYIRG